MVTGGVYKLIIIRSFGRLFLGGFLNQPVNNWNVSNVENTYMMFASARSFNQPLNKWNVSNVTSMQSMFYDATSFNQPLHAPWYVVEQSESE